MTIEEFLEQAIDEVDHWHSSEVIKLMQIGLAIIRMGEAIRTRHLKPPRPCDCFACRVIW